jgi:hypothetical protein
VPPSPLQTGPHALPDRYAGDDLFAGIGDGADYDFATGFEIVLLQIAEPEETEVVGVFGEMRMDNGAEEAVVAEGRAADEGDA